MIDLSQLVERSVSIVHQDLNRQIDEEVCVLAQQGYRGLVIVETWSSMTDAIFTSHARIFKAPQTFARESGHHYSGIFIDEEFIAKFNARRDRR